MEVGSANIHLRDVDTFRSSIDWIKYTVSLSKQLEMVYFEFMGLTSV